MSIRIPAVTDVTFNNVARVKNKTGYDVDLIGGYDFGMFRLEGELGYKRANLKTVNADSAFLTGINTPSGISGAGPGVCGTRGSHCRTIS